MISTSNFKDLNAHIEKLKQQEKFDAMIQQLGQVVQKLPTTSINLQELATFIPLFIQSIKEYCFFYRNNWNMSIGAERTLDFEKYKKSCEIVRDIADKLQDNIDKNASLKLLGYITIGRMYSQLILDEETKTVEKILPFMNLAQQAFNEGISLAYTCKSIDPLVLGINYWNATHLDEVENDTKSASLMLESHFQKMEKEQEQFTQEQWEKAKDLLQKLIRLMRKFKAKMNVHDTLKWEVFVQKLRKQGRL